MPALLRFFALAHRRAAVLALVLSLALHAWLFGEPGATPTSPVRAAPALQLLPPVPAPAVTQAEPPTPAQSTTPAVSTEPPANPRLSAASAAQVPMPSQAPAATALLRLAGPAEWHYRLRQAGRDGVATLAWEPQSDGRYALRLTRRIGERSLPTWESLGRMGSAGLSPERFALQMRGRDRQAINFDNDQGLLSFSASPAQLALPDGAQDRLSWWLQLAALVQAQPSVLPGSRWRLWVAGLRGEVREWVFESMEADPDGPRWLALRRLPLGPEDPGLAVWLDPDRGYWPARLRQGDPELRGFELRLDDPLKDEVLP